MKTNINFYYNLKKSTWGILLISSLALVSCTDKMLPAFSKAENRMHHRESFNRSIYGAQITLSPYTEEYKAHLQKKYFGRVMQKKFHK